MKVKDEIELADIGEVPVQHLDKVVNAIQYDQLIVILVNARCKI